MRAKAVTAFLSLSLLIAGCFLVPSVAQAHGYGYGHGRVVNKVIWVKKYRDIYRTRYVHKTRWIKKVTYVRKIVHVHTVYRVHHRVVVVWSNKYVHITKYLPTKYIRTSSVVNIRGGGYCCKRY